MPHCQEARVLFMLQALLGDVRELVAEARWGELDDALRRIQGAPNNLDSNARDAAYSKHPTILRQMVTLCQLDPLHHRVFSVVETSCRVPEDRCQMLRQEEQKDCIQEASWISK
jgi:hypothetical protein